MTALTKPEVHALAELRARLPRPTLMDRVIGYFNPAAGVERLRARATLSFFGSGFGSGGYSGARSDRPGLKEWSPGAGSGDSDSVPDLQQLRARSRDLARNAPIATGAISTQENSVVGIGLRPQAMIDREVLGLTDEQADAQERLMERIFVTWASQPCDIERRNDFFTLQGLVFRTFLESGDTVVLRRFRENAGDLLGLKLQVIEADRVSNPNFLPNTSTLVEGIELDADGAPRKFWIMDRHPGEWFGWGYEGAFKWTPYPVYGPESGERMLLHVYRQLRPGQTRGVPYLAPVIEKLKQLDRYSDAEVMAAVVSAMFTVFVKMAAGDSAGFGTAAVDADSGAVSGTNDVRMGAGMIANLAPGEEIQIADPKRPNAQFDPFVRAVLNQIGVALDLPFELLIKHFASSYSASRAALLEAWRSFKTRRGWFTRVFCQPCYDWVIHEAVLRGHLSAPGFLDDPIIRRAWLGVSWHGPTPGQINPLDEANAAEKRVQLGVSTLAEETAELTGGDWERKHAQRSKEVRKRRADGLEGGAAPVGGPPAPSPARPNRDKEDEDEREGDDRGKAKIEPEVANAAA